MWRGTAELRGSCPLEELSAGPWKQWLEPGGAERVGLEEFTTFDFVLDQNHFDRSFLRILKGWLFFLFVSGFFWSLWNYTLGCLPSSFAATQVLSLKWTLRQSSLYLPYQQGAPSQDTEYHLQTSIKERDSLLPSQCDAVALGRRCISCMTSSIGPFVNIAGFVKVVGFFFFWSVKQGIYLQHFVAHFFPN